MHILYRNISLPLVQHFYDELTSTLTYVVRDPESSSCAIIDSVLDLDYASGTISYGSADKVVSYIESQKLTVEWILETHVHADHLSAAPYLQGRLGGRIAIGDQIRVVQEKFGEIFNETDRFARDGSQFDVLLAEGDEFSIGGMKVRPMHTPGHTPACMSYLIGDAVFVGDTLFMPDYGTARCDFPGGDASTLFRSIQRILELPADTRIFLCHDYRPDGRPMAFDTTVAEQLASNVHIGGGKSEGDFVRMREARDATLDMPTLILPSLQVNMRAGHVPPAESGEKFFLKIPLNAFGGDDLRRLAGKG